ncbi:hypothetical protein BCO9919_02992 [Burkholderia cenocepacia]|uniref:Uncharacterized protein n=1 Tax=Burkholderia cenocepacia TaxID=95486 RepID=A0A6J5J8K9_9BURK|nr:hypothetical protein BCO9919_02992 [Burkholderia cenocepacia]
MPFLGALASSEDVLLQQRKRAFRGRVFNYVQKIDGVLKRNACDCLGGTETPFLDVVEHAIIKLINCRQKGQAFDSL